MHLHSFSIDVLFWITEKDQILDDQIDGEKTGIFDDQIDCENG